MHLEKAIGHGTLGLLRMRGTKTTIVAGVHMLTGSFLELEDLRSSHLSSV